MQHGHMNVKHTILHNAASTGKQLPAFWWRGLDLTWTFAKSAGAIYQSQRHNYNSLKPYMVLTGLEQWTPLL
jgi:hypothetical protein